MRKASVAGLKARLSQYLDSVKAGEEIIVTERGRAVARLGPINLPARDEARLTALIRADLVRPARRKLPRSFWTRRRPADPDGRALAALREERAESR